MFTCKRIRLFRGIKHLLLAILLLTTTSSHLTTIFLLINYKLYIFYRDFISLLFLLLCWILFLLHLIHEFFKWRLLFFYCLLLSHLLIIWLFRSSRFHLEFFFIQISEKLIIQLRIFSHLIWLSLLWDLWNLLELMWSWSCHCWLLPILCLFWCLLNW